MALTREGDALTVMFRQQQLALRARTLRDLAVLWPALDLTALDRTWRSWATAVGTLVDRDRLTQAELAKAYLRAFRAVERVPGAAVLVDAPALLPARLETALRVTSDVSVKANVSRGMALDRAGSLAFIASSGAATRFTLEAARDVITGSTAVDPAAAGWRRVARPSACSFCRMLAGRGAVYSESTALTTGTARRTKRAAGSRFHDHCGCTVEPAYG